MVDHTPLLPDTRRRTTKHTRTNVPLCILALFCLVAFVGYYNRPSSLGSVVSPVVLGAEGKHGVRGCFFGLRGLAQSGQSGATVAPRGFQGQRRVRRSMDYTPRSSSSPGGFESAANIFTGIGLMGKWQQIESSYILRPKGEAKSVILFLGGAFVGAAPQQWYRLMAEEMAKEGHIVVSTPYQLEFDYSAICRDIQSEHSKIMQALKQEYGELPVIGMGHSCGSLLHTLLSSDITESESFSRTGNVLISFNNKPVKDAIPAFETLVTPAAVQLTSPSASSRGPVLRGGLAQIQSALKQAEDIGKLGILPPIYQNEVLPFIKQTLSPLDQLPKIFEKIAEGVSDFTPTTPEIQQSAKSSYNVPDTLLVKFKDDSIDETDAIGSVLAEAGKKLATQELPGSHVTPCTQDPFFETPFDVLTPQIVKNIRRETQQSLLSDTKNLVYTILDNIEKMIDNSKNKAADAGLDGDDSTPPAEESGPRVVNKQVVVPLNVSEDSDFTPFL